MTIAISDLESRLGTPAERTDLSTMWCYGAWAVECSIDGRVVVTRPKLKGFDETLVTTTAELDAFLKEANWGGANLRHVDPEQLSERENDEDVKTLADAFTTSVKQEFARDTGFDTYGEAVKGNYKHDMAVRRHNLLRLYTMLQAALGMPTRMQTKFQEHAEWSFESNDDRFTIHLDFVALTANTRLDYGGISSENSVSSPEEVLRMVGEFTRRQRATAAEWITYRQAEGLFDKIA